MPSELPCILYVLYCIFSLQAQCYKCFRRQNSFLNHTTLIKSCISVEYSFSNVKQPWCILQIMSSQRTEFPSQEDSTNEQYYCNPPHFPWPSQESQMLLWYLVGYACYLPGTNSDQKTIPCTGTYHWALVPYHLSLKLTGITEGWLKKHILRYGPVLIQS